MNRNQLELVVSEALNKLFARDGWLLEQDASEWSVAHRLAVYLEQSLPGWNVDCEYNRQGEGADSKTSTEGSRVRPDIIIHHRGRPERNHNLLVIELKDTNSDYDVEKVIDYTSPPDGDREFQYRYGLTVVFGKEECRITWFENGEIV